QEGVRGVVGALRRGEAEAAWLPDPPAWAVEELAALDGVRLGPGTDWEMVTFNQANPLLAEEWARVAIATALDTEAILDATVRTGDPEAPALSATMWPDIGTPRWKRHDPEAARDIREDNGCEAGDDGIYVCGGVRMSFTWATTSGDAWRE